MPTEQAQPRKPRNGARLRVHVSGPLGKALALAAAAVLLIVAFAFSVVLLAVIGLGAVMIWGYLLWRTRDLQRQLHEYPPRGRVIEGELTPSGDAHDKVLRRRRGSS